MCALKCKKIILIYQNEAMGISVHCVVYEGESISRFICHSGAVPRPANHTFPFSRLVQFIECFH